MPPWLVQPIVSRLTSIPLTSIESHEMSTTPPQTDHIFSNSPHHTPNHCLVNEYKPGQGIMPHEDGSAYHPVVATVSLGAPIVLDVHEKSAEGGFDKVPTFRILQEPRSLLITTGTLYADYLHGIARETKDKDLNKDNIANWDMLGEQGKYSNKSYERETRISLTYRDVKAVIKASRLIPGLSFGKR
jgi:alkylated DNA repair protein alkB family protein 6